MATMNDMSLSINETEQKFNSNMETTILEKQYNPVTEAGYIAQKQLEVALLKHQSNTIAVGIVVAIAPIASKFGISFKVTLDHGHYFYNSTVKDSAQALELINKMLPVGQKVAFQYKSKINGSYCNKTIETIFYTNF